MTMIVINVLRYEQKEHWKKTYVKLVLTNLGIIMNDDCKSDKQMNFFLEHLAYSVAMHLI